MREGEDTNSEDAEDVAGEDDVSFSVTADKGAAPGPAGEISTIASFVDLWKSCFTRLTDAENGWDEGTMPVYAQSRNDSSICESTQPPQPLGQVIPEQAEY